MKYWLMKTEPDTYSFDDLKREGTGTWDGVRNYQARNFMQEMKVGDRVLIYHSVTGKEIIGIAEVVKEAYPDPTTNDARWVAVSLKAVEKLPRPVGLEEVKADPQLAQLHLVRQGRLSVMPVSDEQYKRLLQMGNKA